MSWKSGCRGSRRCGCGRAPRRCSTTSLPPRRQPADEVLRVGRVREAEVALAQLPVDERQRVLGGSRRRRASHQHSTPIERRCSGSPIPESWSRCGVSKAPAESTMSPREPGALSPRGAPTRRRARARRGSRSGCTSAFGIVRFAPLGRRRGRRGRRSSGGRARPSPARCPAPSARARRDRRCAGSRRRGGLDEAFGHRIGVAHPRDVDRAVPGRGAAASPSGRSMRSKNGRPRPTSSPRSPSRRSRSLQPRIHSIAFIALQPPRTLPRGS